MDIANNVLTDQRNADIYNVSADVAKDAREEGQNTYVAQATKLDLGVPTIEDIKYDAIKKGLNNNIDS